MLLVSTLLLKMTMEAKVAAAAAAAVVAATGAVRRTEMEEDGATRNVFDRSTWKKRYAKS